MRILQGMKDRMDEAMGEKKYMDKYPSKEARSGHSYNESKKHRMSESRGMKKAMRDR